MKDKLSLVVLLVVLLGCRTPSSGGDMEAETTITAGEGAVVDATTDLDREEGTVEAEIIKAPVTTHRYGLSPEAAGILRDITPRAVSLAGSLFSSGLRVAFAAFGCVFGLCMILFWVPSPARLGMWWLYGAGSGLLIILLSLAAGLLF